MDDEDDPLAQYRRPGVRRPERPAPERAGGKPPYVAFEGKDKLLSLDIRRVRGTTHSPRYNYLLNVAYDHGIYETFVLYYSFMQVKVRGRNLREVITAINLHKCEYIQDFHPGEYEQPKPNEPLIEAIMIEWRGPTIDDQDGEKGKAKA